MAAIFINYLKNDNDMIGFTCAIILVCPVKMYKLTGVIQWFMIKPMKEFRFRFHRTTDTVKPLGNVLPFFKNNVLLEDRKKSVNKTKGLTKNLITL